MKLTEQQQRAMRDTSLARLPEETKRFIREEAKGDALKMLNRHEMTNKLLSGILPDDMEAAEKEMSRLADERRRRLAEEPDQRSE
ncbi:hypothetical protein [Spiribacter onubensis]|uniref:Uncharacterized protein n=1 Tax=Spiribacter onubensis TaxID=3122420 RepID=A0ABV3S6L5_9GAMM